MLMKIDQAMESGGSSGDDMASPPSRGGSLSPMALPLSSRGNKHPYSHSPPLDRNSPLGPPTSLAAHHMINSIAASSAAKNMTPGILASLSLSLNAMSSAAAASFHHHDFGSNSSFVGDRGLDRHPYGSPPAPVAPSNDPTANECKLVDYRGQKVAAFVISGETMLCLPQAFELFLKHLVGGLHTVYTKLKRLDIVPIVCNVEQVRILRGLGAIQPGVNRCKLLSCKDFDVLYKDCTTARQASHSAPTTTTTTTSANTANAPSTTATTATPPLWSRIHSNNGERLPGRPPKRTSVPLVGLSGHGGPSHYMMKKHRMENGDYSPYDHGHHNPSDIMRLEKSPLLANGYNHPPTQLPPMHLLPLAGQSAAAVAAAHAALFSPSGIPLPPGHPRDCRSAPIQSLDAARNATWETCRTAYEDFVKQFESRYHEECSDSEKSSHANEAGSGEGFTQNGNLEGASPVLNLSKNTTNTVSDSDEQADEEDDDDYSDNERRSVNKFSSDGRSSKPSGVDGNNKSPSPRDNLSSSQQQDRQQDRQPGSHVLHPVVHPVHEALSSSHHHLAEVSAAEAAISSTENLLRNIQGLLKVAADNAKQQERRVNLEKSEFKMEIMRERELREQLEKQLVEERNLRIYYEKRWKKERRFRKKLEDTQEETSSESPSLHHHHQHNQQQQHTIHSYSHSQQQQQSLLNNNEKCSSSENANAKSLQTQHLGHHGEREQRQRQNSGSPTGAPPAANTNSASNSTTPSTNTNGSLKGDSSDR